ncbi:MAG TPA: beta-galactosidase trimerization domain-containing protein, partial [Fimbriimonadaceae bacterium]|nr:beta-galactosidase trimerization domain-containing protein [Fimbriimonadaceae bacterium]
EFYAGRPAVTVNRYGKGEAYYVASRNGAEFQRAFLGRLIDRLDLERATDWKMPEGVMATRRGEHLFLLNCTDQPQPVSIGNESWRDEPSGKVYADRIQLAPFESLILTQQHSEHKEDLATAALQGGAS